MDTKEKALEYLAKGLSVIPLQPKGKKPLINWTEFQARTATEKEIEEWFQQYPQANIGIITGKVSGIIVVDVDSEEAMKLVREKDMPETPIVKTSKGYHLYCKYSEGVRNFQKRADLSGIDLRAEGGYVVAPPSVHESGHIYKWIDGKELSNIALVDLPEWVLAKNESEKTPLVELYKGVSKGERNSSLARLVGSWVNDGLTLDECLRNAHLINSKNNPPDDKEKVNDTVKSIFEKHRRDKQAAITEKSTQEIHPALDYVNDTALVTLPLKLLWYGQEKRYWVITDKKEIFPLEKPELDNRGFHQCENFFVIKNRWQYSESIKPWLDGKIKSNPKELYCGIKGIFEYHLDYMDTRLYDYMPLWSIGTYFFPLFEAYPIVFLNGVSGSGKSKTITIIDKLAFNSNHVSDTSDASLFRIVQGMRASLLLDENEKIANSKESMGQINKLLAGFLKGSSVHRTEKNKNGAFMPQFFEVYSPKLIANIRGMNEDALQNRCVIFYLTPSKGSKANSYPNKDGWPQMLNHLYIFTMEYWREINQIKNEMNKEELNLHGYQFLVWCPILVMAKFFEKHVGGNLYQSMLSLAQEKSAEREEEKQNSIEITILEIITGFAHATVQNDPKAKEFFMSSVGIRGELATKLDINIAEPPRWFTPSNVGKMVRRLDIGKVDTQNNVRGHIINLSKLQEIKKRFGLDK